MPKDTRRLHLTGRLLLWSIRHWVRASRQGHDLPNFVRHTLAQLPSGATICCLLEGTLMHLALGARRPLGTADPDSPRLTPDEAAVLDALLAMGFELEAEARWCLAELQHRDGLCNTVANLGHLARTLARQGLRLSPIEDFLGTMPFTAYHRLTPDTFKS